MMLSLFRMFIWLALCALVYVSYPTLAPAWLFAVVAAAGLWLLYRIAAERPIANWVVIDGSNVMHWFDETPSLNTVSLVATQLIEQGYRPIVWFDANVGYKVGSRYMNERALAQHLPVSARAIRVSPKGEPADPLLITEAIRLGARVVSNDRFRDWRDAFPQLADDAFLIRAKVHATGLTMEIKPVAS